MQIAYRADFTGDELSRSPSERRRGVRRGTAAGEQRSAEMGFASPDDAILNGDDHP